MLLAAATLDEAGDNYRARSYGQLCRSDGRKRRVSEERYLHALGADVLIDEKAEEASTLDGRHHRARGGGRSAIDRVDAGACAHLRKKVCHSRLGALALQHGRIDAEHSRGI